MSEMVERRDLLRQVITRARLSVEEFDAAWAALDRLADTATVAASTVGLEAEGHTFVPIAMACSHCGKTPLQLLMGRPVSSNRVTR